VSLKVAATRAGYVFIYFKSRTTANLILSSSRSSCASQCASSRALDELLSPAATECVSDDVVVTRAGYVQRFSKSGD
jgi:hypothetical protein